jgi:cell division protein FtsQ
VIFVTSIGAIYTTRRKPQKLRRIVAWIWFLGKCIAGLTLCVALGGGAYTGYLVVRDAEYFRLHTVHIVGNQTLTRQDIHYLLALPTNTTLFQLDLPRMGDRLQRHPYVKAVALRRQFPDTLTVTIAERVPHLVAFSQGQGVLLDTEGVVLRAFSPQHDSALPQLVLRQQRALEPGMRLRQDEVQRALELVRMYRTSPLAGAVRLVALTVEDSGASVWELASYPFTIRLGEGNVDAQLGRLLPVLQYVTQQRLVIRSLDLSYHQRVVIVPVKL